ncbi:uncharacterized protein LOC144148778 [Haemaphysalis longicornis]
MGPDVATETGESSQADPAPPTMDSCEASNSYSDGSAGDGFVEAEHTKRTGSGRNKRKSAHSGEESHPGEFCGPKQTRFEENDSGHCGVEITPEGTVQIGVTLPPDLSVEALASLLKSPEAASGTSIGKLPIKGEINFKISSDAGSSRIDTASQLQSPALSQEMFDSIPATASQLQSPAPSQEMSDNNAAVVAVRDSSEPAVEYKGQDNKELISLEVYMIKKDAKDVYLIAEEGELSCYDPDTGEVTGRFPVGQVIKSSVLAWGHIYLGLGDGKIAAFNIKLKKMGQQKRYSCFKEGEAVTCIRAVEEQKWRLLYAISDRGNIVVCCEDTRKKLWRVDRKDYVPTAFGINKGCIYVTTPDCRMHKLQGGYNGMTKESFFCERAFVGFYFYNKSIIFCSCDGKIRVCHINDNDLECKVVYYGAGKKDITCMDVTSNLVATGNSEGCWEVVKLINMKDLDKCTRCICSYRFAREEDLQYHLEHDHNGGR